MSQTKTARRSSLSPSPARMVSAKPAWNRCIEFNTTHGTVTVKVTGPEETARTTRDVVIEALKSAGVKIAAIGSEVR